MNTTCDVCNLENYTVGHYDETGRFQRAEQFNSYGEAAEFVADNKPEYRAAPRYTIIVVSAGNTSLCQRCTDLAHRKRSQASTALL